MKQYIINCMIVFAFMFSVSNAWAQTKNQLTTSNEIDSLKGFDEEGALKRMEKLGIPANYSDQFLEREKAEYKLNRFGNTGNRNAKPSKRSKIVNPLLTTSTTPCNTDTVRPYCSDTGSNLGFEKGNLTNWMGRYGISSDWNEGVDLSGPVSMTTVINGNAGFKPGRHTLVSSHLMVDPIGRFQVLAADEEHTFKLGNPYNGSESEVVYRKFQYDPSNHYVVFKYAVVMEDPGHPRSAQPYFEALLFDKNCNLINCASIVSVASPTLTGFKSFPSGVYDGLFSVGGYYKPWSYVVIDLDQLGTSWTTEDEFTIVFKTGDCGYGAHFGYAYVELGCDISQAISFRGRMCKNRFLEMIGPFGNTVNESYFWKLEKFNGTDFEEIESISENTSYLFKYRFLETGLYRATLTYKLNSAEGCNNGVDFSRVFTIEECVDDKIACQECIPSFSPVVGESYSFDVWVREDAAPVAYDKYNHPGVQFAFHGAGGTTQLFRPSGPIIDGWQRITGTFVVPEGTSSMDIVLKSDGPQNRDCYFDDLRIYPSKGTVKAFVYDPVSLKLVAELDDNNFAKFYEYNQEGNAVRVKVETEKGVFTLKEQGSFIKRK